MALSTGHPASDLWSFQLLGLRTRVSHAATVRVHTKKYLWAERCGERRREFGRRLGSSVTVDIVWARREVIHGPAVDEVLNIIVHRDAASIFGSSISACSLPIFFSSFPLENPFFSFPRLLLPTMIFRRLHYCPRARKNKAKT